MSSLRELVKLIGAGFVPKIRAASLHSPALLCASNRERAGSETMISYALDLER